MYDSVTATNIPVDPMPQAVAGYVDGSKYAWHEADWQRFTCPLVRITVTGSTLTADVIDVENGDATSQTAASWCKQKIARSQRPSIYTSYSNWSACTLALAAAGVKAATVDFWIADYGSNSAARPPTTLFPGAIGWQYVDTGPYDLSIVTSKWGVIARQLVPSTLVPTDQEDEMSIAIDAQGHVHIAAASPQGHLLHFESDTGNNIVGGWSVTDITDAIGPAGDPTYTVSP